MSKKEMQRRIEQLEARVLELEAGPFAYWSVLPPYEEPRPLPYTYPPYWDNNNGTVTPLPPLPRITCLS